MFVAKSSGPSDTGSVRKSSTPYRFSTHTKEVEHALDVRLINRLAASLLLHPPRNTHVLGEASGK